MKFIDNFKTYQVEGDQRIAYLSYLESNCSKDSNWLSEGEASMPELSIRPQTLSVQLDNKTVASTISNRQIEDLHGVGIDAIEQVKVTLKSEQSINLQKEVLTECENTAKFKNKWEINQNKGGVKGIRRWFWDLFSYHPEIWIESDNFLSTIFSLSNEIAYSSRMGHSDWIIIHPMAFSRFEGLIDFEFERSGRIELNDIITHVGRWKSFKIFTCHLMDETQVLMGRSPKSDHDTLISIVKGPDEWLRVEDLQQYNAEVVQKIGLRTPMKVFSIPGAEKSYIKWNFQYEKPSLRKYLKESFLKILKQK